MTFNEEIKPLNFIEQIIEEDIKNGFPKEKLRFRFPPEPNGYLHLGHAKAICLNFQLGEKYEAPVNLRFDDTNPAKEEQEYVDAIRNDIKWLGFQWTEECYASDYFEQLYLWAILLIEKGLAYVDLQTAELINEQRKTPTEPGIESPYRTQAVAENLRLFEEMKAGRHPEGAMVLRAKIDMQSTNMFMRDPVMYRILHKAHHRTGNNWCIYPTYDWAHGQSDYIEQISHSLCSLEFIHHRPLYEWYLDEIYDITKVKNKQREFARGNVEYMITSKRKLLKLIEEKLVTGWDDPRMPTISGLRRRGYTPESIRTFWEKAGIAKRENVIDIALLEYSIRDHLNQIADRVMAVLDPIKVVITNYPEDRTELLEGNLAAQESEYKLRKLAFGKTLYIEREDFMEEAPKKFFRLSIGQEVRLKYAYIIKANTVVKDDLGNIIEIHCTYDPATKSGSGTEASKRKVKGTLHWVSATINEPIEVRLYDRLFTNSTPDQEKEHDFLDFINPKSLQVITAYGESYLKEIPVDTRLQFQRIGYFIKDIASTNEKMIFNRTVTLKDTWAKQH